MGAPFQVGQELIVQIDSIAYGGEGIAKPEGFTIFVPRTAPGDIAKIQVQEVRKRHARAWPLCIDSPSALRRDPQCQYFDACGGCHYQHLPEDEIWQLKRTQLKDTFNRIGPGVPEINDGNLSPQAFGYRNRMTFHRKEEKQGYIGWRDYALIDIEACPVAQGALNALWSKVRKTLQPIPSDHLPFVHLRSTTTGQLAITLSVNCLDNQEPDWDELESLMKPYANDALVFISLVSSDSKTPFGDQTRQLFSDVPLVENICGVTYEVRPQQFFQVNPEVTVKMVQRVLELAKSFKSQSVLDMYSGTGLFALLLAHAGIQSLGIESMRSSVESARLNAKRNGLTDLATFRVGKAERVILDLVEKGQEFDLIIVDPPRKGLPKNLVRKLQKLRAQKMIYISCAPPTLARDLTLLKEIGFNATSAEPFDMFPQTYHMETLTVLETF